MKKYLVPVLTAALCAAPLSAMAAPSEAQDSVLSGSILKGLAFGDSRDQVTDLLGNPSARYTDQNGVLVLSYMASVVCGLPTTTMEYGFSEDKLVTVRCFHADPAEDPALAIENYGLLSGSLTDLLGDPVYNRFSLVRDFSGSGNIVDEAAASLSSGDSLYSGFWQDDSVSAEMKMEKVSDSSILITVGLDASADRKVYSEEVGEADSSKETGAAGEAGITDGSVDSEKTDAADETTEEDKAEAVEDPDRSDESVEPEGASVPASTDFKIFRWGDSVDDVTGYEGTPSGSDGKDPHESIYYLNRSISGKNASLAYYFRKNRLLKAVYLIQDTDGSTASLAADYKDILDSIAAKYGSPVSSGSTWDTDDHKFSFEGSKEIQALEQGYLTWQTFWYTSRSVLSVSLGKSSKTGLVTLSASFQDADVFFGQTDTTEEVYTDPAYPDGF